jgi:hypothetical protein
MVAALTALLAAACAGPAASTGSPASTPSHSTETAGTIAGQLGYPAEGIPPMTIYAIRQAGTGADFYTVRTIKNQSGYSIKGVAPGTYQLYAIPTAGLGPRQHFMGGYTKSVLCGLAYECSDHSPVTVTVAAGQSVTGIAVTDFYIQAPDSFPFVPSGAPAATPLPSPSASYPDAMAAALFEAQRGTQASRVLSVDSEQCPVNEACVSVQDKHDGTRAAYFIAKAGSNTDLVSCGVYVFLDGSGWHPLNTACGVYPAPGKSVSPTFMGGGCVNVRANPGSTGKIVECLTIDSTVTIDAGPVFVPETTASDARNLDRLWWHLANHGWMVHQFLTGVFKVD